MASSCSFPIDLSRLESPQLRLIPFNGPDFETHASILYHGTRSPDLWQYMRYGPFDSVAELVSFYRNHFFVLPSTILFSIILKQTTITRTSLSGTTEAVDVPEGTFAGITGIHSCDVEASSAELGNIVILPAFQRTFVATAAHALLLQHLLDPQPHDLGLRRIQWRSHLLNEASIKAAKRLGFCLEGIKRYDMVAPEGKIGVKSDRFTEQQEQLEQQIPSKTVDGRRLGPGRHTALLSLCWDDWIVGGKEHLLKLAERR